MRFRPCIDIHDGKVKQIVGSSLRDGLLPHTNFETDLPPSHFARLYQRDALPGGHVILLGKGNEEAAYDALEAFPGGMHAGGGVTADNAMQFIDHGASHVIVTSYVFSGGVINRENLDKMEKAVGCDRLVLDLSCKLRGSEYFVVTDRWQCDTDIKLTPALFDELGTSCDEFLIHAAHVEGLQKGIDADLVALLALCDSRTITYAGGVRSLDDLALVKEAGRERIDVTIGSALDIFGGSLSYRAVCEWFAASST
jgi:phosphoribosylformimino-5-aminoimidazole carboxamide ribotide isomerase